MTTPLESLVACGTRLWLDSVDPDLVRENFALGATGATSNPIIIGDLIRTGRFDAQLRELAAEGLDDEAIAWQLTDRLVRSAQDVFQPVRDRTGGDDGYVSFELDPLLEDAECTLTTEQRSARYIELGKQWSAGHTNRMIKVPATPAGLGALEELCAAGVTLNVTLLFSPRQYEAARDAIWRGAQRRPSLDGFKSVYSIFVSRVDVYTEKHVPELSPQAQGMIGIVNAKRIWRMNRDFWADKNPEDPVDKYVAALAGADIQTNPPAVNAAIQQIPGKTFERQVDQLPPDEVLTDIDKKIDMQHLETTLMAEGLAKLAQPQKELIDLIAQQRKEHAG